MIGPSVSAGLRMFSAACLLGFNHVGIRRQKPICLIRLHGNVAFKPLHFNLNADFGTIRQQEIIGMITRGSYVFPSVQCFRNVG